MLNFTYHEHHITLDNAETYDWAKVYTMEEIRCFIREFSGFVDFLQHEMKAMCDEDPDFLSKTGLCPGLLENLAQNKLEIYENYIGSNLDLFPDAFMYAKRSKYYEICKSHGEILQYKYNKVNYLETLAKFLPASSHGLSTIAMDLGLVPGPEYTRIGETTAQAPVSHTNEPSLPGTVVPSTIAPTPVPSSTVHVHESNVPVDTGVVVTESNNASLTAAHPIEPINMTAETNLVTNASNPSPNLTVIHDIPSIPPMKPLPETISNVEDNNDRTVIISSTTAIPNDNIVMSTSNAINIQSNTTEIQPIGPIADTFTTTVNRTHPSNVSSDSTSSPSQTVLPPSEPLPTPANSDNT